MITIEFNKWSGRLGNRLMILCNAIEYAQRHGHYKISFHGIQQSTKNFNFNPNEDIFRQKYISLHGNNNISIRSMFVLYRNEYPEKIQSKQTDIINGFKFDFDVKGSNYYNIMNSIVRPILNIKDTTIPDDCLLIHIRWGDTARFPKHLHYDPMFSYFALSRSFYDAIISKYEKLWIIGEPGDVSDTNFDYIVEKYKSKIMKIDRHNDIITDASLIANTKNLVISNSTFCIMFSLLMSHGSKVFVPEIHNGIKLYKKLYNGSPFNVEYVKHLSSPI